MKISELEDSLPHGFHDAWIQAISIDYVRSQATFSMEVWVGLEEASPPASGRKQILRQGELVVRGLQLLVIPQPKVLSGAADGELDVMGSPGAPDDVQLPPLRPEAFVYSFWVGNWANSIVFAGEDAEFRWSGP